MAQPLSAHGGASPPPLLSSPASPVSQNNAVLSPPVPLAQPPQSQAPGLSQMGPQLPPPQRTPPPTVQPAVPSALPASGRERRQSFSPDEARRSESSAPSLPVSASSTRAASSAPHQSITINSDPSQPLLPRQAASSVSGWRIASHATDAAAAVTAAPYSSASFMPAVQGVSGALWAASGVTSFVDNIQQQPANMRERVGQGLALASDSMTTLAGLTDMANAGTNAFAQDDHAARRGTGQASNALWAAAGLTSMVSTGYQTVNNWWNGRSYLSQGLGFVSATFNTLGAGFGMAATEYSQGGDPASQFNATLYGSLSAASWGLGAVFGIGSTIAAQRQRAAGQN